MARSATWYGRRALQQRPVKPQPTTFPRPQQLRMRRSTSAKAHRHPPAWQTMTGSRMTRSSPPACAPRVLRLPQGTPSTASRPLLLGAVVHATVLVAEERGSSSCPAPVRSVTATREAEVVPVQTRRAHPSAQEVVVACIAAAVRMFFQQQRRMPCLTDKSRRARFRLPSPCQQPS